MLDPIRYYVIIKIIEYESKYKIIVTDVIVDCCHLWISDMTSTFLTKLWLTLHHIITLDKQ